MAYSDTDLYSPLSPETIKVGEGKALLLQFILSELLLCAEGKNKPDPIDYVFSTPACFFPFDWSYEAGCLNKIHEHAHLLSHAFENEDEAIDDFQTILTAILDEIIDRKKTGEKMLYPELMEVLSELFFKLTPFLIACKESENLVLFLLKHTEEIKEFSEPVEIQQLIRQMAPAEDFEKIRNRYELRGFKHLRNQFDTLIAQYEGQ